jgi:hypothetical protein
VPILHYLRTKTVNCRQIDLKTLKHEAEFYGVLPLGESEMRSPSLSPRGHLVLDTDGPILWIRMHQFPVL